MKDIARNIKQIFDETGTEGFTRGNGCFGLSLKELERLYAKGYVIDGEGGSLRLSDKAIKLIAVIDKQKQKLRRNRKIGKIEKLHNFLLTLPKTGYPPCNRRNGKPADGWVHGCYRLSRAIAGTGLPCANYWSGSLPTPSTQYPEAIYKAAKAAGLLD